jgi:predicted DNA-binding transcriptional regulator AlpA
VRYDPSKHISQSEAARLLGVPVVTVWRWTARDVHLGFPQPVLRLKHKHGPRNASVFYDKAAVLAWWDARLAA